MNARNGLLTTLPWNPTDAIFPSPSLPRTLFSTSGGHQPSPTTPHSLLSTFVPKRQLYFVRSRLASCDSVARTDLLAFCRARNTTFYIHRDYPSHTPVLDTNHSFQYLKPGGSRCSSCDRITHQELCLTLPRLATSCLFRVSACSAATLPPRWRSSTQTTLLAPTQRPQRTMGRPNVSLGPSRLLLSSTGRARRAKRRSSRGSLCSTAQSPSR